MTVMITTINPAGSVRNVQLSTFVQGFMHSRLRNPRAHLLGVVGGVGEELPAVDGGCDEPVGQKAEAGPADVVAPPGVDVVGVQDLVVIVVVAVHEVVQGRVHARPHGRPLPRRPHPRQPRFCVTESDPSK
eukprot:1182969-Prorocentrum_minimum.AAC.3